MLYINIFGVLCVVLWQTPGGVMRAAQHRQEDLEGWLAAGVSPFFFFF